jgi:hypothetical protein
MMTGMTCILIMALRRSEPGLLLQEKMILMKIRWSIVAVLLLVALLVRPANWEWEVSAVEERPC